MKIDRLLSIILLLLNREKVTAGELAEYFETSIRTIYRDIETLDLAGIPIISQQGSGGGFSLMPNFKLDKQVFKPDELLALITGLKGVESAFQDQNVSSALEKVKALAPEAEKADKSVVIDFSGWGGEGNTRELISLLYRALSQNICVQFQYTNLKNETTERTVEPYRLFFRGANWYLLAYCCTKKAFRFFKVRRLHQLETLNKTFAPRVIPDADMSFLDMQNVPSELMVLRVSGSGIVRAREWFPPECITTLDDGRIEVQIAYPLDEWVYSYCLGYGDTLEVLSPLSLKEELLKRSRGFLELNGG